MCTSNNDALTTATSTTADTNTGAGPTVGPLADPTIQNLFVQDAPNALDPSFIFNNKDDNNEYKIVIQQAVHDTGLINRSKNKVNTTIWGYGEEGEDHCTIKVTWPGKTFEVQSNKKTKIKWTNDLTDARGIPLPHILPLDNTLHWCYSLPDKTRNLTTDGVPLVAHLHGGHSTPETDGNPEYFEGLTENSRGPRFVSNEYHYDNSQRAGALWYHDHALGMTRLNVYTGLAGFYIIRDEHDTGKHNNPLNLPAKQYELAYCVQDRYFKDTGELFYPAFKKDPIPKLSTAPDWDNYIDNTMTLHNPDGPSALAEFFGDHILVNGKLWPKANVEPRHYRIRLLNGSDSRFMKIQLRGVAATETDFSNASGPLPFTVIGADQGLLKQSSTIESLDFMPGERLDIVIDFSSIGNYQRVIVENILGDAPYDGTLPAAEDLHPKRRTDRIMAFDINLALNTTTNQAQQSENDDCEEYSIIEDRFNKSFLDKKLLGLYPELPAEDKVRKLALFEGQDEFGRLKPLLGTAEPVTDVTGNTVNGSLVWDTPITENPALGATEIWEIYNATVDAHPIHVHLVHFEILSRQKFNKDDAGVLVEKPMRSHSSEKGIGFELQNIKILPDPAFPVLESEKGAKDMVLCYPGEVTRIKMTFDRAGRYVWHCHILSHEDHEMMRPFHVGKI